MDYVYRNSCFDDAERCSCRRFLFRRTVDHVSSSSSPSFFFLLSLSFVQRLSTVSPLVILVVLSSTTTNDGSFLILILRTYLFDTVRSVVHLGRCWAKFLFLFCSVCRSLRPQETRRKLFSCCC